MSANRRFDPSINYYAVLNVSVDATTAEITRTYRQLMRRTHPDNFSDPYERLQAEERAKEINAAYAVLSRPRVREEYDRVVRRAIMTDTVRQRYAGAATSPRRRPTYTQQPRRRVRTIEAERVQRSAFNSAIWQLVITFGAIAVGLIVIIVLGNAALEGLRLLFT